MRLAVLPRIDSSPALPAFVIGGTAALVAAAVMQLSLVWVALVSIGLLVFCGSLIATDAKLYWLSIFLAAVPLNITKLFFWTPDDVSLLKQQFQIYVNENMVPQLYLADLPLLMLLTMWSGEILSRRRRIEVPRATILIAGFIAWALLTTLTERAPILGASWAVYEVKLLLMFIWFVNARLGKAGVRQAIVVLIASLALQSAIVFYSYAAQTGDNVFGHLFGAAQTVQEIRQGPERGSGASYVFEDGSLRRGTGTIGTANLEAKYFTLLLPLALVGAVCARRPLERIIAAGVVVGGVAALYFTYSRGGLLTTLGAMALVPIFLARGGLWNRKAIVTAFVSGLTALACAAPILIGFMNSRPGFTQSRFDQIRYGIGIWWQNPFAGIGMNNFNLYVSRFDFDGTFGAAPIHNHYLRIAIETGLIGFVLYFAFFVWALRLAYRLTASQDSFVAASAAGLCAALVGTAVYFTEDLFYDPIVRMQIWIVMALVAVLAQLAQDDPRMPRLAMWSRGGGERA